MNSLFSTATVTAVGLTCKLFLNIGYCSLTVNGLPILRNAIESSTRHNKQQGVITVANHISTLDDPVTWGVLPAHYYLRSRTTRWALGASDIIFTNPVFSTFFRLGQTLETFRGEGIHQGAVDTAISQLNRGGWVHLYGEGKVHQPKTYPQDSTGHARLPRFKWGVGRIVMEAETPPIVIPMWLTGFNQLMPEGRPFPYKYLPRPGVKLSVTFGDPIPDENIRKALGAISSPRSGNQSKFVQVGDKPKGWMGNEMQQILERQQNSGGAGIVSDTSTPEELIRTRAEVTSIIHDAVESLGYSVSGKLLDKNRHI